jgi:hypothetical protein
LEGKGPVQEIRGWPSLVVPRCSAESWATETTVRTLEKQRASMPDSLVRDYTPEGKVKVVERRL